MAQLTNDVDTFLKDLADSATIELDEERQAIAGQLVDLLGDIERVDDDVALQLAGLTLNRLTANAAHVPLCKAMVATIQRRIAGSSYFRSFWRALVRSPVGHVLAGMSAFTMLVLIMGQFIFVLAWQLPNLMGFRLKAGMEMALLDFVFIAAAGAAGSLASIMTRIGSAEGLKGEDMNALFVTGLFKPLIGMLFGLFVAALYKSGFITIQLEQRGQAFIVLALAFVAGFSERLVQDIIRKVEDRVGGGDAAPATAPPP